MNAYEGEARDIFCLVGLFKFYMAFVTVASIILLLRISKFFIIIPHFVVGWLGQKDSVEF